MSNIKYVFCVIWGVRFIVLCIVQMVKNTFSLVLRSANPALSHFKSGGYYGFYDFCALNLVAYGYNEKPATYAKPEVQAELDSKVNKVTESHYVADKQYVVEETPGHDHKDDKVVQKTYEKQKKVGYITNHYEEKSYEKPSK